MSITLSDEFAAKLLVSSIDPVSGNNSLLPIELLHELLSSSFSTAEFDLRKSDTANGIRFLNIYYEELEVAVQWSHKLGFGLSCFKSDVDELDGLYATPDEWFKSTEAVYHRIASLLLENRMTRCITATMAEIRNQRGLSQTAISAELEITQATYSRLERREDVKLSSLRKVIEAMGGVLKIEARFPESQDVREITLS